MPRPRQAWGRQPDRLRPLRQTRATSSALLPHLPLPVLRAERNAPVRLETARGQSRLALPAPRRAVRRAGDGPVGRGEPQHGRPLQPPERPPCSTTPRRVRGFFPLKPVRSSSTRSGRTSSRNRNTANRPTPPTTTTGSSCLFSHGLSGER